MTAPSFLKKLMSDPPPRFAFEISESGIAAARIASPPEIGFQPLDADVIAVSPVHDNVQRMEALTQQVRALAPRGEKKRVRAALILPDHSVRVSVLDFDAFPDDPKQQLPLVRFRLKKSLPFDIDAAAISYYAQPNGQRVDVVVAAAPLEVLTRYEMPFRAAGFHLGLVTTSTLCALEMVKGTGVAVALPTYPIAGKTGTAYKFMNGHYSRYNYVSSFVGFVPAEKPRFVIYISLDDPRGLYWGGYTAGPVFKEVAKRALAYELVPAVNPENAIETAGDKRAVPAFTGLTKEQCKWVANRDGLGLQFEGKGERVIGQSLAAGVPIPKDEGSGKIILTLGTPVETEANGVMPDLRGKTKRQALALLSPLGVRVNFKGQGIVKTQFPPAGRAVQANTPCDINCDLPVTKIAAASGGNS